jgi:tetratricopeptide (TPR) repeat protein
MLKTILLKRLLVCGLVQISVLSGESRGSDNWASYSSAGLKSYSQNLYADAVKNYEQALTGIEKSGIDDFRLVDILNSLGMSYLKVGQSADAVRILTRADGLLEHQFGSEDPRIEIPLNNLALAYQGQGNYRESENLARRVLRMTEKNPSDGASIATSLNNLAQTLLSEHKIMEATSLHQRALRLREKAFGQSSLQVAESLNNIGACYIEQKQYASAIPFAYRCYLIRREKLSSNHPDISQSLNNLGYLYMQQNQFGAAEPLLKRAIDIDSKNTQTNPNDRRAHVLNYATLLRKTNRLHQAQLLRAN